MPENRKNLLIGMIFIIIGAVWALDNVEIIPWQFRHFLFRWENILILIGSYLLISKDNVKAGAILLSLGVFFSLDNWFGIYVTIFDLWPLLLVFTGIYLIARNNKEDKEVVEPQNEQDLIEDTAIFSGGDKIVSTKSFKGGTLTAMFGGSNIDLTTADIQEGTPVIDVFYMFGGSKIRVPQNWHVELRVTNLFGAISDKRIITENSAPDKKLIIKGLIIFGGSEITN